MLSFLICVCFIGSGKKNLAKQETAEMEGIKEEIKKEVRKGSRKEGRKRGKEEKNKNVVLFWKQ